MRERAVFKLAHNLDVLGAKTVQLVHGRPEVFVQLIYTVFLQLLQTVEYIFPLMKFLQQLGHLLCRKVVRALAIDRVQALVEHCVFGVLL